MVLEIGGGLFGQSDVRETEVNIALKTRYLSVHPAEFQPKNEAVTSEVNYAFIKTIGAGNMSFYAPVNLPHGAVVTACVLYQSNGARTWFLSRIDRVTGQSTMASAFAGVEDTSISFATVDNINYSYGLHIADCPNTETLYGARITYTTDVIEV